MTRLLLAIMLMSFSLPANAAKITHYFTYLSSSLNRKVCKMEGNMFVNGKLYYWHNGRCILSRKQCRWGIGHRLNCLTPCQSIAADKRYYRKGQRVFIKSLKGKRCPSTGQRMNGYFTVADVGAWIKGKNRFDLFTGICSRQSGGVCSSYTTSRSKGRVAKKTRKTRTRRNTRNRSCGRWCQRTRQYRFQDALLGAIERDQIQTRQKLQK